MNTYTMYIVLMHGLMSLLAIFQHYILMVSFIGEYLQYLEKTTDLLQVTGKPSCVITLVV
jgi:hypothetical protein